MPHIGRNIPLAFTPQMCINRPIPRAGSQFARGLCVATLLDDIPAVACQCTLSAMFPRKPYFCIGALRRDDRGQTLQMQRMPDVDNC